MLLHTAPKMPIPRHPSSRHRVRPPIKRKATVSAALPADVSRSRQGNASKVSRRRQPFFILHSSFFIYIHPDKTAMFRT